MNPTQSHNHPHQLSPLNSRSLLPFNQLKLPLIPHPNPKKFPKPTCYHHKIPTPDGTSVSETISPNINVDATFEGNEASFDKGDGDDDDDNDDDDGDNSRDDDYDVNDDDDNDEVMSEVMWKL